MKPRRATFSVLFLTALSVAVLSTPLVANAQQNDAASAISAAQSKILQCLDLARAAESAGANISRLTAQLNNAGSLLSQAEMVYAQGDLASASSLATQSQSSLTGFISEASSLKSQAVANSNLQTIFFVGSILGPFFVIAGGVVIWRLLKRKYDTIGVQKNEPDAV